MYNVVIGAWWMQVGLMLKKKEVSQSSWKGRNYIEEQDSWQDN